MAKNIQQERETAGELEGTQDQGGKHGGQAGVPEPTPRPRSDNAEPHDKPLADPTSRSQAKAGTS